MACWAGGPSTAGGTPVLADSRVSTAPLLGDSTLEETVSRGAAWQHHGSYAFSLLGPRPRQRPLSAVAGSAALDTGPAPSTSGSSLSCASVKCSENRPSKKRLTALPSSTCWPRGRSNPRVDGGRSGTTPPQHGPSAPANVHWPLCCLRTFSAASLVPPQPSWLEGQEFSYLSHRWRN